MGSARGQGARGSESRVGGIRVHVTVTDESGRVFHGDVDLLSVGQQPVKRPPARGRTPTLSAAAPTVELELPLRPFLKKYASGKSGPAKFSLVVAHLAKGKANSPILYTDILR